MVFKIGTRADETVIAELQYQECFKNVTLKPPNCQLQGPVGKTLHISGTAWLLFKLNGRKSVEDFFVLTLLHIALL